MSHAALGEEMARSAASGRRPARRLIGVLVRRQRRHVIGGAVLLSLWQAAEAAVPVTVGIILDRAVADRDTGALLWGIAALALLFFALTNGYRWASRVLTRGVAEATADTRVAVTARVLDEHGAAPPIPPGDALSATTIDAAGAASMVEVVAEAFAAVTALGVAAAFLVGTSPQLGLLVLLGLPPLLVVIRLLGVPLERHTERQLAGNARAVVVASDLVTGIRVLKGLGATHAATRRYVAASDEARGLSVRAGLAVGLHSGIVVALTALFGALVALVGGRLALDGEISVGQLIAAIGLTQFLVGPFTWLGYLVGNLASARASAGRVAGVLDTGRAVASGSTRVCAVDGRVELTGASTGAPGGRLSIAAGTLLGVVAEPDRARAIVSVLARDVDPPDGAFELDGHDVRDLRVADVRSAVLVVRDESVLEATLGADLVSVAVDAAAVDAAVSAASLDEMIASLPDGRDTAVTERGRSLSGGERQRVALARALAADRPVLVLHDPTTAIDTVTESHIAQQLAGLRRGRTTVLVTTSPTLLAVCDDIALVVDGTIERGTHVELAASRDDYRRLVLA